jgi:hypothetical protein
LIFIISEKGGNETLNEVERLEVIAHISRRTSKVLGNYRYCEHIRKIVIADILGQLRHEFGCDLNKVRKKYIADIHEFIDCYELPIVIKEEYEL